MIRVLLLCGICSVSSVACGDGNSPAGRQASSPQPSNVRRVALLLPGLADDGSWNQAAFEGLKRAEGDGVQIAYTEKVTQDQQLEIFRNYARRGFHLIIGGGGEYLDSAMQAAAEFPQVQFVVANATKAGGNVTALALSYGDMGYLAGVLAGLVSKSQKVAMVSGPPIPIARDGERGFRAGVARVRPNAEVQVTYTGSFDDVEKAREATLALAGNGIDAVWQVLDGADVGVLTAAEDRGIMAIGLYADQSRLAPTAHVGAALADPARLVYEAATRPELLDGRVHLEGVAQGIVSAGAFSPRVSAEMRDQLKTAEGDLAAGRARY